MSLTSAADSTSSNGAAVEARIFHALLDASGPGAVPNHKGAHSRLEVSVVRARVSKAALSLALYAVRDRDLIVSLHLQHAIVGTPLNGLPGGDTRPRGRVGRYSCDPHKCQRSSHHAQRW